MKRRLARRLGEAEIEVIALLQGARADLCIYDSGEGSSGFVDR